MQFLKEKNMYLTFGMEKDIYILYKMVDCKSRNDILSHSIGLVF